jgi:hypothetical protein
MMTRSASLQKRVLYSGVAGTYSYSEGARYFNPVVTRAICPELVELHEAEHEYLANVNFTDGLGRLYAGVLEAGAEDLRAEHKQDILDLFKAIWENTTFVHEFVATYNSFLICAHRSTTQIRAARGQLASEYQEILHLGEATFGNIEEKPPLGLKALVLSCAIAAMNLPFSPEMIQYQRLRDCIDFIKKYSPDDRFKTFIRKIQSGTGRSSSLAEEIFKIGSESIFEPEEIESKTLAALRLHFPDMQLNDPQKRSIIAIRFASKAHAFFGDCLASEPEEIQRRAFATLRSYFLDMPFITLSERPTLMREWLSVLVDDGGKYFYDFLDDVNVGPPLEESIEHLSAKFTLPGYEDWEPIDLSLRSTKYAKGSISEFLDVARACHEQGPTLFCHVFAVVERNLAPTCCFALDTKTGKHAAVPIALSPTFEDLLRNLQKISPGKLVIKLDEIWGTVAATKLAATGHPVCVLPRDTRAEHFRSLVQTASKKQTVTLTAFKTSADSLVFICAHLETDRYFIVAPFTDLGAQMVGQSYRKGIIPSRNTKVIVDLGSKPNGQVLGLRSGVFPALVHTCFIEGPMSFDPSTVPDLLRGLYTQDELEHLE